MSETVASKGETWGDLGVLKAYFAELWEVEDSGLLGLKLLNSYLGNRLALIIRNRLIANPPSDPTQCGFTPAEYLQAASGLMDDCQSGVEAATGKPMSVLVFTPDAQRARKLEQHMLSWASAALGEAFGSQVVALYDQQIGQERLELEV